MVQCVSSSPLLFPKQKTLTMHRATETACNNHLNDIEAVNSYQKNSSLKSKLSSRGIFYFLVLAVLLVSVVLIIQTARHSCDCSGDPVSPSHKNIQPPTPVNIAQETTDSEYLAPLLDTSIKNITLEEKALREKYKVLYSVYDTKSVHPELAKQNPDSIAKFPYVWSRKVSG